MFKFVVALAFVAACSATYNVGLGIPSQYYVDVGYKYIKIANPQGDVVNFVVDNFYGYNGPQNVLVQFYGQGATQKAVEFLDQQTVYSQRTQSDILYQIFNNYDGPLDEIEYDKLINIISTYVQNGQIHPAVLYALQALSGEYEVLSYFDQHQGQYQQGLYQQTPYNQGLGALFGKGYGYGYNQKYGMSYYPGKYSQVYGGNYGPYSTTYQYLRGQSGYGYPQKYYGGIYGQQYGSQYGSQYGKGLFGSYYPQMYGSQFGKGPFGSYYPQQYQQYSRAYYPSAAMSYQYGSYYPGQSSVGYYGPYANTYSKQIAY